MVSPLANMDSNRPICEQQMAKEDISLDMLIAVYTQISQIVHSWSLQLSIGRLKHATLESQLILLLEVLHVGVSLQCIFPGYNYILCHHNMGLITFLKDFTSECLNTSTSILEPRFSSEIRKSFSVIYFEMEIYCDDMTITSNYILFISSQHHEI